MPYTVTNLTSNLLEVGGVMVKPYAQGVVVPNEGATEVASLAAQNLITWTGSSIPLLGTDQENVALRAVVANDGTRRAAILGDSRVQQNFDQSSTAIYAKPKWWNFAQAISGHRLDLIQNAGVNGESLSQMAARISNGGYGAGFGAIGNQSTAVTTAPGILGLTVRPDVVFFSGGINDILGGSTAATALPIAISIIETLRAAGIYVVVVTPEQPSSAQSGYSAAKCRELRLYVDGLASYAGATKGRGVWLCDTYSAMLSATSSNVETAGADFRDGNLHENNSGGLKKGVVVAALISQLFPDRQSILPASNAETSAFDSAIPQLVVNPLLTGTASITATGYSGTTAGSNLANANFVRSGSASAVLSAITRADGRGQNIRFTTTFTAASETLEFRGNSVHAQAVVGARYRGVCEVSFTGPSAAALAASDNLRGVQAYLQYNDGTTNYLAFDLNTESTDVAMVGSRTLLLRTPELTIPSGGTPTVFRINVTITANGAGSPVVDVGRVGIYRTA